MFGVNQNLYSTFEQIFNSVSNQVTIEFEGGSWTYSRLVEATDRLAGALGEVGVGVGDRVVVQAGKCPLAVALYLACLKTGSIYVPLNTSYTVKEVEYFVTDADPELIVVEDEDSVPNEFTKTVWTLNDAGDGSVAEREKSSSPCSATVTRDSDDIAAILYTSGTTGRSKGAMLTHANLLSNAQTLVDYWSWQPNDVLLHTLPLYHVHGLFVALHCVFLTGTSTIFHSKFDAEGAIKDLSRSTVFMGVPTYYSRFLAQPQFDIDTTRNVRLFISGSAPLSKQVFELFESRTGKRILERYGMSETLMNTSNPYSGDRVAGTVGFALPGIDVRIVDATGKELPVDEVGDIELKGPNVFPGYWRMPEKTKEEFREDGFFRTGDMGFKDSEGRVSIVGREKDLVITGGLNVYPAEVETLLDEIDGVEESAVIGIAHADFGEGVVAVLAADRSISLEEVRSHLADNLASFKHPKAVRVLDELPHNAMGKVQKNELRTMFLGLFDAENV